MELLSILQFTLSSVMHDYPTHPLRCQWAAYSLHKNPGGFVPVVRQSGLDCEHFGEFENVMRHTWGRTTDLLFLSFLEKSIKILVLSVDRRKLSQSQSQSDKHKVWRRELTAGNNGALCRNRISGTTSGALCRSVCEADLSGGSCCRNEELILEGKPRQ